MQEFLAIIIEWLIWAIPYFKPKPPHHLTFLKLLADPWTLIFSLWSSGPTMLSKPGAIIILIIFIIFIIVFIIIMIIIIIMIMIMAMGMKMIMVTSIESQDQGHVYGNGYHHNHGSHGHGPGNSEICLWQYLHAQKG